MDESQSNSTSDSTNRVLRLHDLIQESKHLELKIEQQATEESLKTVSEIMKAADNIIEESTVEERAVNTNEVVLDSMVLKFSHALVGKIFQQATSFNDNMLIEAIKKIVMKDNDYHWDELAKHTCFSGKTVYSNPSMLGYVDIRPKERAHRERQPQSKSAPAVEQRPETSNKLVREDKGSEAVKHVLLQIEPILRANGTMPYFQLVIDPNNFSNTVHNCFQLSFLLRENVIAIEDGDDGYPQVRLLNSSERKTHKESAQAICTLSMALCQRMIDHYQITKPIITWPTEADLQNDDDDDDDEEDSGE